MYFVSFHEAASCCFLRIVSHLGFDPDVAFLHLKNLSIIYGQEPESHKWHSHFVRRAGHQRPVQAVLKFFRASYSDDLIPLTWNATSII